MTTHQFTENNSKMSPQVLETNYINNERKPKYEKTFLNRITGDRFIRNEVQIMKYKRNLLLKDFNQNYNSDEYTWLEIGVDFSSTTKISDVLLKLKRNLKKIGFDTLGYFWLVDKGDYCSMHFHLLVAIKKIDIKGKQLPNEFKLTFKERKIHSAFVYNKPKMIEYLLKKPIYYIGKRKRVFGKSRHYYNINKHATNKIQNNIL